MTTPTPMATTRLRDGRALAYDIYGDPDGRPVINCHGGVVCRLDVAPADEAARAAGLRIISPDRPGVGGSDRAPGRRLLDWVDDVRQLADVLALDGFDTLGWSMGGQYALALASGLGDRVARVTVVAGCPPLDDPACFDQLSAFDKRMSTRGRHHELAARATFAAMRSTARHLPAQFASASARSLGPHDAEVARRRSTGYARMVAEGLRQTKGAVDEYRAFVEPWGFDASSIEQPVRVWWGDQDQLVPRPLLDALVALLPSCEVTVVADAGHFVAYDRWAEVLGPHTSG